LWIFPSELTSISTPLQIEDTRAILYCQLRKEWRSLGGLGSGIFAVARDIQSRMVRRTALIVDVCIRIQLYHGRGSLEDTEDGV